MSTRIICRLLVMCGLVAGLSMSGSVAQAECYFCDFSDGSCCSVPSSIDCSICIGSCGAGVGIGCDTPCAGYHGVDCRLRNGDCVSGWDETCCLAAHGEVVPCALAAKEEVESEDEAVCESDDSDSKTCPAHEEIDATPPATEDAFCYCPGGICCNSTCFPGAHCCIAGVGYECCDDSQCTPPEECVWRMCLGGPD